jgi:plasmid maintenance system antidote protein VapI
MRAPRKRWPKGTWMRLKSGSLLRELMNTKRLSNADVAMSARVGRTFISALVNERRTSCTPVVAERIAERLEVPLEVLFVPRASAVSSSSNKPREKAKAA